MPEFSLGPFLNAEKELWDVKSLLDGGQCQFFPQGPKATGLQKSFF